MSKLNIIKERLSNTAKSAAKTSGEIVEISKNKISISNEQNKIKNLKTRIGDLIFEAYKTKRPVDEDIKIMCENITESEKKINTLQAPILTFKKLAVCPSCKTEVPTDFLFCSKCGSKL